MFIVALSILFGVVDAQDYDVLVLGAGASGLGAAQYFHENGLTNFLVLEGNDYIGGRMKNKDFGGASLPLGPGWIHFPEENHILVQLAVKYNLSRVLDTLTLREIIFRNSENGSRYDQSAVLDRNAELSNIVTKMNNLITKREDNGRGTMDLRAALRWAGWKSKTDLDEALEVFNFDFENGVKPDGTAAYVTDIGEGDNCLVTDKRGYAYGFLEEAKPFIGKIRLNQEIVSVTKVSQDKFDVSTKNGSKYSAKHVIVTFSSGVLSSRVVKFQPDLPEWKYEALTLAPMNHFCKVFLLYNESFWDDSNYFVIVTKFRGWYMIWQNVKNFYGPNILMSAFFGDICKESHQKSDETIKAEIYEVLKNVYKNATMPTALLRSDWSTNRFFYGSYSVQIAGITEDDKLALVHPVNKRLWFTGEYTDVENYGYVHGAYQMGQKVAKSVKECMDNQNKCPKDLPGSSKNIGSNFPPSLVVQFNMVSVLIKFVI